MRKGKKERSERNDKLVKREIEIERERGHACKEEYVHERKSTPPTPGLATKSPLTSEELYSVTGRNHWEIGLRYTVLL